MRQRGEITDAILSLLAENGTMTRAEICEAMNLDRMYCSSVLSRLNRNLKTRGKRIHIVAYVHDHDGSRPYPRAVYALGNGKDAKKPKAQPGAAQKRYREKLKGRMKMNSVFNMGITQRQMYAIRKEAAA